VFHGKQRALTGAVSRETSGDRFGLGAGGVAGVRVLRRRLTRLRLLSLAAGLRLGRLGGVRRIRLFAASESAAAVACVAFAPAAALAHRLPCRLLLCSSGIFFNPSTCRSSATPALRRPHARQLRRWRHSGPQWSTVTWYVSALAMALPACRDCSLRAAQQHASTTWFSCHLPVSLQFSGTFVRLESKLTGRSSPSQMLLPLRWPPPTSASTWPSRSSSCCCRTWGEACAVRPAAGAPVRRPASFAG